MSNAEERGNMKMIDNGCFYSVRVSAADVSSFNATWPCSNIPERSITFKFDRRNGDLVDIHPDSSNLDGDALVALTQDAREYAEKLQAQSACAQGGAQ
jgi:hypothetical protein